MRNVWNERPEYIVNLTKTLIGEKSLAVIVKENVECDPQRIRSYVMAGVLPKLERMKAETLGRICEYASAEGGHHGNHKCGTPTPKFISRTGLNAVYQMPGRVHMFSTFATGEYLEYIALAVIICVVADMIRQDQWQVQWHYWVMTEEEERQASLAAYRS